jgi:CarD family transcriptional regulator
MSFQVGDIVVHPAHGIGQIVKLEEKRFFGKEISLYYEVAIQHSTVWVPFASPDAQRLRTLTLKSELPRYRSVLKSPPAVLNKDYRQRHLELAERLKPGSFLVMCEIVRDLTARGWHKSLNELDAVLLQRMRRRLCDEWATALSISVAAATEEVTALLLEGRKVAVAS